MKKQRYMLPAIAAAAALICAGIGIRHYIQEREAGKGYEDLREQAVLVEEPEEEEPEDEPVTEPEPEKPTVEIPIDFETLWEQNPDIYAWIRVPGTDVDYPVLQSEDDNGYYLTHTIDGVEAMEGSIYTENYNSKEFDDPHTVIYGHNMKNGSMFRSLHNYEDKSFFDEHREILIYLPDAILEYRIFAAYVYDNRHLLLNYDFDDPKVFQQYLDDIFAIRDISSHIDASVEVGVDDRILTLSTCNAGISSQRYLVQAVLISIDH